MTNAMMNETQQQALERLTDAWKFAKAQEQDWNAQRIAIESEIYTLVEKNLPEKGTFTTDTVMKITTGFGEEWDQAKLAEAYSQWDSGMHRLPSRSPACSSRTARLLA